MKYWAFISYSNKDRQWGEWLRRRLENYRIPKDLRSHGLGDGAVLGKYLRPIFRDRDELPGSDNLNDKIREALSDSRYLIVLCSPNSAQSRWVNKEITDFQKMGRSNYILALILEGVPNSDDPATECLPPALRHPVEPVAGDLRKEGDGKVRGFLKIVAGIAQLTFDQVYRRHERAVRRRRLVLSTVSLSLVLIFAGISVFALWQRRQTLETFSQADFDRAIELLETDYRWNEGLAYLARALRSDPANRLANQRALNLLIQRNWAYPALSAQIQQTDEDLDRYEKERFHFQGRSGEKITVSFDTTSRSSATYLGMPRYDRTAADVNVERILSHLEGFLRGETPVLNESGKPIPVAYSPDGRWMAVPGQPELVLFDRHSGERAFKSPTHGGRILCAAFSPEGLLVATGGYDNLVRIWNLRDSELFMEPLPHKDWVNRVAFSTDGRWLASFAGEIVRVWNLENRRGQDIILPAGGEIKVHAWSSGKSDPLLAIGTKSGQLCVFDPLSAEELFSTDLQSPIYRVFFSRSEDRVIAVVSDRVEAWNIMDKKRPYAIELPFEIESADSLSFDHVYDTIAVGDRSGKIVLINLERGDITGAITKNAIGHIKFVLGGQRLLVGGDGGIISLYSSTDGTQTGEPLDVKGSILEIGSNDDQVLVFAQGAEGVRVWDVLEQRPLSPPVPHDVRNFANMEVAAGAFSASVGTRAEIRELDGQLRFAIQDSNFFIGTFFSQDGSKVVSVPNRLGRVRVFDSQTGMSFPIRLYGGRPELSPDGKTAFVNLLWDIETGRELCDRVAGASRFSPLPGVLIGLVGDQIRMTCLAEGMAEAPNWFPDVLEAVGGLRVNVAGTLVEEVKGRQEILKKVQATLETGDDRSEHCEIVRWWLQLPRERAVNPFARINLQQWTEKLVAHDTGWHELTTIHRTDAAMWLSFARALNPRWEGYEANALQALRAARALDQDIAIPDDLRHLLPTVLMLEKVAEKLTAPQKVSEGRQLAREGKIEEAIAKFEEAQKVDPGIDLDLSSPGVVEKDPQAVALRLAVSRGLQLVQQGATEAAVRLFTEAQKVDPEIDLDPTSRGVVEKDPQAVAEKPRLVRDTLDEGFKLAMKGEIEAAIKSFEKARELDPIVGTSQFFANYWNGLAWLGSLNNYAEEVAFAGEVAIQLRPESPQIQDTYGLNLALRGRTQEAIHYFKSYCEDKSEPLKSRNQRKAWIEALQKGENPFSPELLEELKKE